MAFSAGKLVNLMSGNSAAGRLWVYSEDATLATVRASGYFDSAVDYGLADGDVVILICSDGFGLNDIAVSGTTYTVNEALTSA